MDQQKSDDDTNCDIHDPDQDKARNAARHGRCAPRTVANNQVYTDLIHAGFRPPQSFQSDRAKKRRRSRNDENSSGDDDDDEVDDGSRVIGIQRPRRTKTSSHRKSSDDVDLDQDTKPRAIDMSQSLRPDEFAPAVVLHRQQSKSMTQKKQRGTRKIKKGNSPAGDQEQLQLFHRLFEPVDGRKNRKTIIIDPNDNNAKVAPATRKRKQKISSTSTNIEHRGNEDRNGKNTGNFRAIILEKPVAVVELPPFAIIRGSITHKIRQKLNRLDTNLVYDDPFQSECNNSDKVGNNNGNKIPGENVSKREEVQEQTTLKGHGDNSTLVEKNGVDVENLERSFAQVSESVCIRSAIVPQMIEKSFSPDIHVVILYGEHRGRTGM